MVVVSIREFKIVMVVVSIREFKIESISFA